MKPQRICRRDEITDPGSKQFTVRGASSPLEGFVVRRGDLVAAFVNQCPHTGVNLNWLPEQFLDLEATHIQCSVHGAMFRLEDGFCVWGPCAGRSLTRLPLEMRGGEIWLIPSQSTDL
ncbi:MAG: Rieske 2Fe-2S domain-containing protein [Proteobacteria bacterium]|nr:Rieske 2Fe-2S domain-containing protein [Pseudomonadota bacterium]MCG6936295.1 Rieske 2Fe-2S domain-containing protein [Pseudomonadota bacterium]